MRFFKGAGLSGWNGEVNEDVAKVFLSMLCQARSCSIAMHWVPRPSYNPAKTWILSNLSRSFIESLGNGQYKICQLEVVRKFRTALSLAASRIAPVELSSCK
jgi:hypothetical protein